MSRDHHSADLIGQIMEFRTHYLQAVARASVDEDFRALLTRTGRYSHLRVDRLALLHHYYGYACPWDLTLELKDSPGEGPRMNVVNGTVMTRPYRGESITIYIPRDPGLKPKEQMDALAAYYHENPWFLYYRRPHDDPPRRDPEAKQNLDDVSSGTLQKKPEPKQILLGLAGDPQFRKTLTKEEVEGDLETVLEMIDRRVGDMLRGATAPPDEALKTLADDRDVCAIVLEAGGDPAVAWRGIHDEPGLLQRLGAKLEDKLKDNYKTKYQDDDALQSGLRSALEAALRVIADQALEELVRHARLAAALVVVIGDEDLCEKLIEAKGDLTRVFAGDEDALRTVRWHDQAEAGLKGQVEALVGKAQSGADLTGELEALVEKMEAGIERRLGRWSGSDRKRDAREPYLDSKLLREAGVYGQRISRDAAQVQTIDGVPEWSSVDHFRGPTPRFDLGTCLNDFISFAAAIFNAVALSWKNPKFFDLLTHPRKPKDTITLLNQWLGYRYPWELELKIRADTSRYDPAEGRWKGRRRPKLTLTLPWMTGETKPGKETQENNDHPGVAIMGLVLYNTDGPGYPFTCG